MLDLTVEKYADEKDLNEYVSGDQWGKDGKPKLCFAFSFDKLGPEKYNYSLHYFDAVLISSAIRDIPNQDLPSLNPFQYGPDLSSFGQYVSSGYLNMMTIINNLILNIEKGPLFPEGGQINVAIGPQKYYTYKQDPFAQAIGFILPFFLVIAYVCPLCVLVFRIVSDKVL
jgi:hypothetical protein